MRDRLIKLAGRSTFRHVETDTWKKPDKYMTIHAGKENDGCLTAVSLMQAGFANRIWQLNYCFVIKIRNHIIT